MEPPKSVDPRRRTVERAIWISLVQRWISLEVARRKNRRQTASGERASSHLISHLPLYRETNTL
ncbi:uncharacterized protein [Drosophila suzukii]|uniref:Uncharacterized protein n=1 Tax=Drosophila suzukii TaxID=28584 RepID=A0ABM4TQ78_DROSZ